MLQNLKSKKVLDWCFFDFGISSYPTLILTFFYGAFYAKYIAPNPIIGTSSWGFAVASSSILSFFIFAYILIVAKNYFNFLNVKIFKNFFYLMILSSSSLFLFNEGSSSILPLVVVVISFISFEVVNLFYNLSLHKVAKKDNQGAVSNLGWGFGYLGGLLALLIIFLLISIYGNQEIPFLGISPFLLVGPFVGIWAAFFGHKHLNNFKNVRFEVPNLINFISEVKKKGLSKFLVSYFFYNNAVICIFAFASMFASFLFGLSESQILFLGIFINLSGVIGCFLLGRIEDSFGSQKILLLCILFLTLLTFSLFFIESVILFWIIAISIGFFVGPIQASSRSLLAKKIDIKNQLSAFSLFSMFGNICAVLGPFLIGLIIDISESIKIGLLVIPVFFTVALLILKDKSRNY